MLFYKRRIQEKQENNNTTKDGTKSKIQNTPL
jgi:hypothetical protein